MNGSRKLLFAAATAALLLLCSGMFLSRQELAGARNPSSLSGPPDSPKGAGEGSDAEVVSLLRNYLAGPEPDVRAAALGWIARDPRARDATLFSAIFAALKDKDGNVRERALSNMGWIFERNPGSKDSSQALAALENSLKLTSDRAEQLVAIDLLRGSAERGEYDAQGGKRTEGRLLSLPAVQDLIAQLLRNPQSSIRPQLLSVVGASPTLQAVPSIARGVAECLHDDNLSVRSDAADLLISIDKKNQNDVRTLTRPILLAALEENDPNVQLRIAHALGLRVPPRRAAPPVVSLTGAKVTVADVPFDFNYFTAFVQPLFLKKYGNVACVDCHTPEKNASGAFRILAPGPDGRYTREQSETNFVSMLAVVDRQDAEKSKLLLKPLDPRAAEGKLRGLTHDGGVFWANRYDPDFEILEGWLKGAKLETPPEKQLDFAYFALHVEPIFSTPGPDSIACINCHTTHAILHLLSPETREGKFSVDQIVNNYQSAHRVVDESAPTNSFIVRKPTSPREGEPGGLSHAGGVRWPDKKESWQYKTLINWIRMRNLESETSAASKTSTGSPARPPGGN